MLSIGELWTSICRRIAWRKKINELLYSIANADDLTDVCLYSVDNRDSLETMQETSIYWYSSGKFEFIRSSVSIQIETKDEDESEGKDPSQKTVSKNSGIVAEESYLIKRILIHLDPSVFSIAYHPQPEDEESEMERFIQDEVREALGDFNDDGNDEDDEEGDQHVG